MTQHSFRSVLYIPASRERALQKARTLACDAIIFDLEDAVAPDEKEAARPVLAAALKAGGYAPRAQMVRINGFDTPWGRDDVAAFAGCAPDYLLLPKVDTVDDVLALDAEMQKHSGYENTKIWAMIESPLGVINAAQIANAPRMMGFVLGTNDLAKDLGVRLDDKRTALQTALCQSVLAAKSAGIAVVDGVYNAFKDDEGLTNETAQGRDFGFDGKTLIHPAQIAITNAAFSPSGDELDLAARQIEAFDLALKSGSGVAVVDGQIVENLHVAAAKSLLQKMQMIKEIEENMGQ